MRGIAVAPDTNPRMHSAFAAAVEDAGGRVVDPALARALVWADPDRADLYPEIIARAPDVEWIQLPYAGIEPFAGHLDRRHRWTCGKGVYADPVAEHVMAAALTVFRDFHRFVPARSWSARTGRNLLGAPVTIIGGGGITSSLVRLLGPWECPITVVRRSADPFPGVHRTLTVDRLREGLATAHLVVAALALTADTHHLLDGRALRAMRDDAWLVNVARGGIVDHDHLHRALVSGTIAGAVLDVTEPEPLPDDSPLWALPNCVITPHVGNTAEMGLPLIARRVGENTRRWLAGEELLGPVDVDAGY
ncbi:MAG: NAD(P)-dependent oxidoreductase [Acidimicrobiales bacterium]